MGFFLDYWYLVLVVPTIFLSLAVQIGVKRTFSKYSQRTTQNGLTGKDASLAIQREAGLSVPVVPTAGSLTDHYDPRAKEIRLSEPVYETASIAAVGVAAHETGHALQHARAYLPIKLRNAIVPAANIVSGISPYLVIFGVAFGYQPLAYAGALLFLAVVLFHLFTLPVELNASARAMKALAAQNLLTEEERRGARKVLTAAALTYVAALINSLMTFLYLLLRASGSNRRRNRW